MFFESLGEFGVSRTVGEQWIRHEHGLFNRRLAHLTHSIRPVSKSFERAVNVVQRRFDGTDTLVGELRHSSKLPGLYAGST